MIWQPSTSIWVPPARDLFPGREGAIGYCAAPVARRRSVTPGGISGPTDFATDLFAGTNGTDLNAHTADLGGSWTRQTTNGAFKLDGSGRVYCSHNDGGPLDCYTIGATPPSADYTVRGTFHAVDSNSYRFGLVSRFVDNAHYYCVEFSNGVFALEKNNSGLSIIGTPTTFSFNLFSTNDAVVDLIIAGTALTVKINGVTRITATDSSYASAGHAGLYTSGSATTQTTGVHLMAFHAFA